MKKLVSLKKATQKRVAQTLVGGLLALYRHRLKPVLQATATLLTILCAFTATAVSAEAGAKLRGRVTDQNGAAVVRAMVRLSSREGIQQATLTSAGGEYEFASLAAGQYLLEVEATNFRRRVERFSLQSRADRVLNITLRVSGPEEHVVVTASGTPQSVDEASKSITVVAEDEIERRTELSLVESLRSVPGVRVVQLGGPGTFSKIFIRGLRVVDTSVLIDGLRVRDASDFRGSINTYLEDMLINNVERIEVLRGSGSSLYGSNAVGGVINLVPHVGTGAPRFNLGFEGGSLGQFRERGQLSGGGSQFGYSVTATRLDVNDGVHDGEVYRNTSLGGRVYYNLKPTMSLRGTVTYHDGFNRLTDSPFPIGPAGNEFGFATGRGPVIGFVEIDPNPDNFRDADIFVGQVAFSHQVSSSYNYSVSFQSVVTTRRFTSGPDQSRTGKKFQLFEFVSIFDTDGRIETFNFTNTIRGGRHNLITAGVEAERESFTQELQSPFFTQPGTTDRQRSLALFVQDQLRLLEDRLQFSAAFRTQGVSLKNPESVPEVQGISTKRAYVGDGSMAYSIPQTGTKLRAHVGNSFRAPSLSERFSLFRGQRIGNPFVRPERGLSFDGGLDQDFLQGRVRASATYFYTRLQERIVSTTLLNTVNARGALARGFETSLTASPSRGLDVSAAYTFTNSAQVLPSATLRFDNVRLPAGATTPSFSIPRHSFSLEINQRFQKGFNINFDLYAASEHDFPLFDPVFFSQVIFTFNGYTKADLGVSYTRSLSERKQVVFYAKVDNLFDRRIIDEGFRAPGAVGLGGIKFRF